MVLFGRGNQLEPHTHLERTQALFEGPGFEETGERREALVDSEGTNTESRFRSFAFWV